jgi:phosphatidylglycerol lysyltransferase
VRYVTSNSWWQIVSSGDVPASVRLAVGLSVLVGVVALWRLLTPARAAPLAWTLATMLRYAELGAKPPTIADGIIFDEAELAAIPFRRLGRVLLALGDPAGAAEARSLVLWRLAALARREGRRLAVYGAGAALLDVYGGLGLAAVPLGADGLPLSEGGAQARAFLLCAGEADMEFLLPRLPELAGAEPVAA